MRKILSKKDVAEVLDRLERIYPDAKAALNFSNPFELLIATILSAQCTDVRVNQVTESLFKELQTPQDYLSLGESQLGQKIKSCGFFNAKSKNIIGACNKIISDYNGEVPKTMEELINLPGVGRKTANVVLSVAFDVPGIAVDTHVFRVTNRIGVVDESDVEKTEFSLRERIPEKRWSKAHHLFIFHGRQVCKARKSSCDICTLSDVCLKKFR